MYCDLLVVGGGINGAGIARDAAGRGIKVLLCDQDDLANHTSSASTKLIHGGLRYIEQYEFTLVRKALKEREVLLALAPHLIRPLRFVMPHDSHLRPAWMIRAGLFLYDHLSRRRHLAASGSIDLRAHPAGLPLRCGYGRGFVYSDASVDDARFVILNAKDAVERGASVFTRTRCERLTPSSEGWSARLVSESGGSLSVQARAVVNAAGPWVGRFLNENSPIRARYTVRLVKGSHIVVRKLFDHPYAYIFQNPDGRIIFAVPYEHDFTLIGTTDIEYDGDARAVSIDAGEIDYLCSMVSRYFARAVSPADVVMTYAGVRPLLDDESSDPSSITRDYALELDTTHAPLLSVFGGKITTFRKLAEEAVGNLAPLLGNTLSAWTSRAPLPGGDIPVDGWDQFVDTVGGRYPWLPRQLRERYARAYGTRIERLIGDAGSLVDLGEEVLPQLHAREIQYLCREEWALTAEDILWRRSKLGLHLAAGSSQRLDAWLAGADSAEMGTVPISRRYGRKA
ncbi:MAG: glycerol-3-phosphate dehydrogenase [Steroidobacter sp.]